MAESVLAGRVMGSACLTTKHLACRSCCPHQRTMPFPVLGRVELIFTSSCSHQCHILFRQDEFETWMLLEFCDRGSLHRAIERRRIAARNGDGKIELVWGLAAFCITSFLPQFHR